MTESHPQSNGYPHPPAPPPSSSSASAAAAAHAPSDTRTDAHSTLKSISSSSLIFDGVPLHGRIALLVLDLQEHFRRVSQTILSNLLPLIRLCQSPEHCETTIVIFTQHGHEINATEEEDGELGRRIGRENLIRYDAFYDTNLHDLLSVAGVTTVIVCGVLTNLCCETTARSAFVRDYSVWFLSDGTASRTPEMHAASLLNLEAGFARIMTCAEAMRRVTEREDRLLHQSTHHHFGQHTPVGRGIGEVIHRDRHHHTGQPSNESAHPHEPHAHHRTAHAQHQISHIQSAGQADSNGIGTH